MSFRRLGCAPSEFNLLSCGTYPYPSSIPYTRVPLGYLSLSCMRSSTWYKGFAQSYSLRETLTIHRSVSEEYYSVNKIPVADP